MHLPPVKPRRPANFTDACPVVAVSYFEISSNDAELTRLYFSDYRILVHGAAGDSGQNEAERTNSATMDTVVDDSKINCEYHGRFDELTREEILSLNLIRGIRKWRKNECETRSKSSQRSIQADW